MVERYPEFHKIYEEGYEICLNVERVMEMFSKELYELDRNTVQYMIDEMQDTIDAQKEELGQKQDTIDEQKETITKMQEDQEKMLHGTINILRNKGVPDSEIIQEICSLYGINEEQVRQYL